LILLVFEAFAVVAIEVVAVVAYDVDCVLGNNSC
jgi:hypothetical protein